MRGIYYDRDAFIRSAEGLGIETDDVKLGQFETYAEKLCEWNEKINLTSVTDPYGIAVTHFSDSLTVFKSTDLKHGSSLADIGTGAGFPGIPLKIMRPDIRLTLIDSLEKRLRFLEDVISALGLKDVTLFHLRAEEGSRDLKLRDRFDTVTARAVAAMPKLCEYCLPYVKPGGVFVAMKGPAADDELKNAQNALRLLQGSEGEINRFTLDDTSERCIITVTKLGITPTNYPRKGAAIAKKTL